MHKNIRNMRLINNISQSAMAIRLGISQNAYSKIERGASPLTVKRLYEIAEILNVTVHQLLPEKYQ